MSFIPTLFITIVNLQMIAITFMSFRGQYHHLIDSLSSKVAINSYSAAVKQYSWSIKCHEVVISGLLLGVTPFLRAWIQHETLVDNVHTCQAITFKPNIFFLLASHLSKYLKV